MRFVALSALRDLAVDGVTEGAVKGGMFALIVPELNNLLGVAGDTGICYFARKRNVQGRMRVFVTAETALKFEMGLPHMALIALGNDLLDRRRMAGMTTRTTNVLVFSARC